MVCYYVLDVFTGLLHYLHRNVMALQQHTQYRYTASK